MAKPLACIEFDWIDDMMTPVIGSRQFARAMGDWKMVPLNAYTMSDIMEIQVYTLSVIVIHTRLISFDPFSMSTVTCPKCTNKVVPRLWHLNKGSLQYMKTQHICPICGVCMYESGGEVTFLGKVALLLVTLTGVAIIGQFSKFWGNVAGVVWIAYVLFLLLRWLYRAALVVRAVIQSVVDLGTRLLDALKNR